MSTTRDNESDGLFVTDGLVEVRYFHHFRLADTIVSVGTGQERRLFGVFLPALQHISAKLKAVLGDPLRIKPESEENTSDLPAISLGDEDPQAFELMLAILFQQEKILAKLPTRIALLALARFCARYDLLVIAKPQIKKWSTSYLSQWPASIYTHATPLTLALAHEKMLRASLIFQEPKMFKKALRELFLNTYIDNSEQLVWDLPNAPHVVNLSLLPPGVHDYIHKIRVFHVKKIVWTVRRYVVALLNNSEQVVCCKDSEACKNATVLEMTRHLSSLKISLSSSEDRPAKRRRTAENDDEDDDFEIIEEHLGSRLNPRLISIGCLVHELTRPDLFIKNCSPGTKAFERPPAPSKILSFSMLTVQKPGLCSRFQSICSDFRTLMPRQIKHDMKNIMLVNDFSI